MVRPPLGRMRALLLAALLGTRSLCAAAPWSDSDGKVQQEEDVFASATQMFREAAAPQDSSAAVEALDNFLSKFPRSLRAADARFLIGEAQMRYALSLLKEEAASKKNSASRALSASNPAAAKALQAARKAFSAVAEDKKSGLGASAQYRLGEAAYNERNWEEALKQFGEVESRFPKSYLAGESLLGIVYSYLAMEEFEAAESSLFILGETYPAYLKEQAALYAQGVVALHKGDYNNAEKALKAVSTPEAQYYLGKTYLLSKRAYLAATAFEKLIRDYPESELKEEAQFYIAESFFLAEDYDGAVSKYQRFISLYPDSPLRSAANFRVGACHFQKKDYIQARAQLQGLLDRAPGDFFGPISQYLVAETYLATGQIRDALFAYTKVITQHPETLRVSPLAHYKLAWTQAQVGDFAQAAQTCRNFLSLYPNNALAKNVYLILGNALVGLGRHGEAADAFQRIIDIAPSSEIAEQALFLILQNQFSGKNYNSILTSYQYIFRHMPPSRSKWRTLSYLYAAEAYLALNQVEEAKVIYEMILKVYPDDPAAIYAQDGLAWCYSYEGEDQKALEERQKLKEMLSAASSTFTFSGVNELGIADSLFNQKNYEDSFQLYEKYAQEHPDSAQAPVALYRAGQSLYNARFYTQALEAWKKLMSRYPQAKEAEAAAFQSADTLFRAQKYGESMAAYRAILKNFPSDSRLAMARLRLAQAAYNAKDDAAAVKEVQELVGQFPGSPEASDGLEILESALDRLRKADFKAVLRGMIAAAAAKPIAADLQFRLARRCFEAKDYAEAASEFQKFSVEHTNHAELGKAQFYLGESWFKLSNFQEAIPAFERLLDNFERGENTALALFHLASASYGLKKHQEAIRYYLRLIEEYPEAEYVKAAQFNLALSYKAVGRPDMSQDAYQKYVGLAGASDPAALSALWEVFAIQKDRRDYEGALSTLSRIGERAQPGAEMALEAAYRAGEIYVAQKRPDEAQNAWEKLRPMRPAGNPFRLQALIRLGELYERGSDYEKALAVYDDLARNAGKAVAQSAAQRAAALRRAGKSAAQTPKAKAGRIQ
ncbi:MAG: tetratricopeptide repeat protein [Elusimicrobia bacterium]|nr:tetratricopeptide repeat protein [Elusimicrobiota bacterium]